MINTPVTLSAYNLQRSLSDLFDDAKLPEYIGMAQHVVEAIKVRIEISAPISLDDIAQDLGISDRTLARRLQAQGSEFEHIRNAVRRYYAMHLVVQELDSRVTLSHVLGYQKEDQFIQAFLMWTGLTPSVFRRLYLSAVKA